jgi:type I restriction enzyme M protein
LGKNEKSEQIDILYVEKCLKLLKKGGTLAIVLPEGLLNLPSYQYFRNFILNKSDLVANISMPAGAFVPFGQSNAKTCLLFLRKKDKDEIRYSFMGDASEIGYEVGKKKYIRNKKNDLNKFVEYYNSRVEGLCTTEYGGRSIWIKNSLLDSSRLDAKYYFMKDYIEKIKNSGAKFQKLGEIARVTQPKICPGKKPEFEINYLEVPDISENTGMISNIRKIKGKYILGCKVKFESGDILFTRLYPDKGRIAIIPDEIKEGATSTEISIIRPMDKNNFDPYVLYASLKSSIVTNQVKDLIAGTSSSRPRINNELLKEILVPIPPEEEREKIAELMKESIKNYWDSSQKYLKNYSEVMKKFGDEQDKNSIRRV